VPGSDQGDPPFGVWSDSFKARPLPLAGKGAVSLRSSWCFTSRRVNPNRSPKMDSGRATRVESGNAVLKVLQPPATNLRSFR